MRVFEEIIKKLDSIQRRLDALEGINEKEYGTRADCQRWMLDIWTEDLITIKIANGEMPSWLFVQRCGIPVYIRERVEAWMQGQDLPDQTWTDE